MRRLVRKAILLVSPCVLTFTVSMISRPQVAEAATVCEDRQGAWCISEGAQIQCRCCLSVGPYSTVCVCEEGFWNCGDLSMVCPPEIC